MVTTDIIITVTYGGVFPERTVSHYSMHECTKTDSYLKLKAERVAWMSSHVQHSECEESSDLMK